MAAAAVSRGAGMLLTDAGVWVSCGTREGAQPTDGLSPLAFVDSGYIAGERPVPVASELAAALSSALDTVATEVAELHLTAPTHWGSPRRHVVETAARAVAEDVVLTSTAIAVARTYAVERDVVFGSQEWAVVEACASATTVSIVRHEGGVPRVVTTEVCRPNEAGSWTPALVDAIVDGAGTVQVAAVLTLGNLSEREIDALRTRFGRIAVHPIDPAHVARALVPVPAAPPRRPTVYGPSESPALPPRPRWIVPAVAVGVCAVLVVAVGLFLRRESGAISGTRDSAQTLVLGEVRVEMPDGWRVRTTSGADDGESARLELVATEGPDRRIIVTQTELRPDEGYHDVVAELGRLIAEGGRDSKFGALEPDVEFGGRTTIEYRESPDVYSHVIWHVMVEPDIQVSVGCQSLVGDWEVLAGDCEQLVRTMVIVP